MSRYYDIQIRKPQQTDIFRQYTSFPKGVNDPGALNVVLDAFVYSYDQPQQLPVVQIWGVPLADIAQANNLTGCSIKIYGGFQKGLPLNNPKQAGLLVEGLVFQSFGNWQGTEMTLDLVVSIDGSLASQPVNLSLDWKAGTPLSTALATTLTRAFPGVSQDIQISSKLVLSHDQPGYYRSLVEFSQAIRELTAAIDVGVMNYAGVTITRTGVGFKVRDSASKPAPAAQATSPTTSSPPGSFTVPANDPKLNLPTNQGGYPGTATRNPDGTYTVTGDESGRTVNVSPRDVSSSASASAAATTSDTDVTQIAFQDLIGQPTWIGPQIIQFVCPMRADLSVNSLVQLPQGLLGSPQTGTPGAVVTTAAAQPQARQQSTFTGKFMVILVHHLGNFRQPDGGSWVTVLNATAQSS